MAGCFQEGSAKKIVSAGDARQSKEETAANRLDVFFQRLAIQLVLNGNESLLQIRLVANEQQPLLELTGFAHNLVR